MKLITRVGIALNLIGAAGLAFEGFSPYLAENTYTHIILIGHQQIKTVSLPVAVFGLALVCGIILIAVGMRNKTE